MDAEVSHARVDRTGDDGGMSLLQVVGLVLRRRRLIILWTLVGMLIALGFALRTPLIYTATFSFIPHGGEQSGLSGVSSLAQQFGLTLPRSRAAERSPEFYQDLLQSREIMDGLARSDVEMVVAGRVTHVDLAEHFKIKGATVEERYAYTRRYLLNNVIFVSVDPVTGVITVRLRSDAPLLSAAIGQRLIDLISAFDVETRQSLAAAERGFAGERLGQLRVELSATEDSLKAFLVENRQVANSPQLTFENDRLQRQVVMRQELVTALAEAYEQARIDEVRNTPVITVIDQPEPPALPDRRGRLLKLLLGVILGMMVGIGFAFMKEFGERAKEEGQAYREFQDLLKDTKADLFGFRRSSRLDPSPADSEG